jgi:alpha-D-xyloside xylohydrolase
MILYLKERDYHINLWEHAFVCSGSPIYSALHDYSGDFEVWEGLVPDFATEGRRIFADYHRDNIVSLGIDGFKLDECDNSDFVHDWSFPNCAEFPSGMDGEQYHQMFGTLYMQTMLDALGDTPTLSAVRNAGALAASYPFVLYSDLYDHKDFIRGVVNSGFSGILWTPELRDAKTKESLIRRLQTTVFSVQSLINAWYCPTYPWAELDCEAEVRELLYERERLIPILKRAFAEYKKNGTPPVRALVMDYTDDTETWGIDDEYMLGDSLLVAPIADTDPDEREVYLPRGEWRFRWTGEIYKSGWHRIATQNIPVFERV